MNPTSIIIRVQRPRVKRKVYSKTEKPLKKWTMEDMCRAINNQYKDYELKFSLELFSYMSDKIAREFLCYVSMDRNAVYQPVTDLYMVDFEKLQKLTDDDIRARLKDPSIVDVREKKDEYEGEVRKVKYVIWGGSLAKPVSKTIVETCRLDGIWAYTRNGKVNINDPYFKILD